MFKNIIIIFRIFTKYAVRNPWFYFLGVVFFPVVLLVPLIKLTGSANRIDIFIGSAICSTTIMTIADISDIISHDKYTNALSFFITRPIKPYQYVLGVGLSTLVYNLIGAIIVYTVGILFLELDFHILQLLIFFLIIFIGWFLSSTVGFVIGIWGPTDPRTNTSLASIIAYGLTFLAPNYYSISELHPVLQKLSLFLYTTNLSLIAKEYFLKSTISIVNITIIFFFVIVALIMLIKVFKWKVE